MLSDKLMAVCGKCRHRPGRKRQALHGEQLLLSWLMDLRV